MRKAIPLVLVLTLVWGTMWPLFTIGVREVSVWTFRTVCLVGSGLALLAIARARGESLRIARAHWGTLVAASLTYLVVWNITSTYAAILIPSGQAAILGFTMPLWAALMAWAFVGQRPTGRVLLALAIGGLGVALLIVNGIDAYAKAPLGFSMGLLAGLGWAAGTVILKRCPVPGSPLVLTGWQLLVAAVPLTIGAFAFAEGPWFVPSTTTLVVIAYITLVPMAVGNAAWFAIVGLLPGNVAGLSSVMVPVVAMVSGAIIHHEPLGPVQWASMVCCAAGLALALIKPAEARR
ncbi:DMT family transporter [Variovorax sp. OV700]|uniref:DMT family transporter n=1 Tax=Variovorax sp. OV700 TaxID=1882826 RepID=UPI000883ADC4|nr:DMT family transporter [Variovorax sp. OV700]SDH84683.1 Threonine/homoserine efflux transporter RhtA [Variovorax sp. OV700]